MSTDWRQAACRSGNPDLWFPSEGLGSRHPQVVEAKRICLTECPVRDACLVATLHVERGMGASSRFGIAAGLDGKQRARLDPTPRRINQNA